MNWLRIRLLIATALVAVLGCEGAAPAGAPRLAVHTSWLRDPEGTPPEDVEVIEVIVHVEGRDEPLRSLFTAAQLGDEDGDGNKELVRDGLPTDKRLRLVIEGRTSRSGRAAYVGHIGPLVLGEGERRYAALTMYPVYPTRDPEPLDDVALSPRMLHTATPLPDGRILVAGGFEELEQRDTCPPQVPMAGDSVCYDLVATSTAFVFDPTTGRFYPVEGDMLQARGGHSATRLPDGRILLAGGADRALLALTPNVGGSPPREEGYALYLAPHSGPDSSGAHDTFELFAPNGNAEQEDEERDGDPGRGAFVGAAGRPDRPGVLNARRFMHAAAPVPTNPARVLLAGGMGDGDGSQTTWEMFDARRPGGHGVYPEPDKTFRIPRPMPSAVSLSATSRIWIIGGGVAQNDCDLAEVWDPATMNEPIGTTRTAAHTNFPTPPQASTCEDETQGPEYALVRPSTAVLDEGRRALVGGWYGRRCDADSSPTYPDLDAGEELPLCPATGAITFTVDGTSGDTRMTPGGGPRAFADSAKLSDGSVVLTGGVGDIGWSEALASVTRFQGVDDEGMAESAPAPALHRARLFHRSAALPERGVLTTGGVELRSEARFALASSPAEIFFLEAGN